MDNSIKPQYCDNTSILLINSIGILKKLYCPFRVKVRATIEDIEPGTFLWVEKVSYNYKDKLIYWIQGRPISYSKFVIEINF